MTHGNAVVLIPIACVAVSGTSARRVRRLDLRGLRPALVVLAASCAVIAPWTIRNAIELHAFVPIATSLGNTLAGTYNSRSAHGSPPARWLSPSHRPEYRAIYRKLPLASPAQDGALRRRAFQYIEDHPGYLLTVGVWNTAHLAGFTQLEYALADARRERLPAWSVYAQNYAFWALALLAIVGAFTRRAREAPLWLWAVPLGLFVTVIWAGTGSPLYREPADPFLILLAACGCEVALTRRAPGRGARAGYGLHSRRGRRRAPAAAAPPLRRSGPGLPE